MKNTKAQTLSLLLLGLGITTAHAQHGITAAGGNASGSGGTASYVVGQIAYTTSSGTNGTVSQGVLQPYEIFAITGIDNHSIELKPAVYPNPATHAITLDVGKTGISDLRFELSAIDGKLIESRQISAQTSTIRIGDLAPAAYILRVIQKSKEVKTFKIIKK